MGESRLWRLLPTLLLLAAVAAVSACAPYQRIAPEPGASFAAHRVRGGLMVDAMPPGGTTALAAQTGWLRLHHEPSLVVEGDGHVNGEAIWVDGPGSATVRASAAPDAPIVGNVEPLWDAKAIRLVIAPVGGAPIVSDAFVRSWNGLGPSELSRTIGRSDELYGEYRAALRDPAGTMVGWLEVKVGDEQASPRVYDGAFPPSIDGGLAVASAAALGRELEWIDDHTLDAAPGMVDRP